MKPVFTFLVIFLTAYAAGREVSLSPNLYSFQNGEALTASSTGGDSLFYNPALLTSTNVKINVVSAEIIADRDNFETSNDYVKNKKIDTINLISENLGQTNRFVNGAGEFIEFIFPYFGLKSFARARMTSKHSESSGQEIGLTTDLGAIAGVAVKIGNLSLGYSRYIIKRGMVISNPDTAEVATMRTAIQNGTFDKGTMTFSDFTNMYYGEAMGENLGFSFKPLSKNNSGLGISVLNLNKTKFNSEKSFLGGSLEDLKNSAENEAYELGLILQDPTTLPQMVNVGLNFDSRDQVGEVFYSRLSFDIHDVSGSYVKNKLAVAGEFGMRLPDNVALAFSLPIKIKDQVYHIGLRDMDLIVGHRYREYYSAGLNIGLHIGYQKVVSLIRIDLNAMILNSLNQQIYPDMQGVRAGIGLTFIIPDVSSEG